MAQKSHNCVSLAQENFWVIFCACRGELTGFFIESVVCQIHATRQKQIFSVSVSTQNLNSNIYEKVKTFVRNAYPYSCL